MAIETAELDQLQKDYKTAPESWITAIRKEEALASTEHSVADIDQWKTQQMSRRRPATP